MELVIAYSLTLLMVEESASLLPVEMEHSSQEQMLNVILLLTLVVTKQPVLVEMVM